MRKAQDLWIALLLGLTFCYFATKTPGVIPESGDAAQFSAQRALKDIRVIAQAPHPIGSEANSQVRDYLIARMKSLGLSPRVQQGSSFEVYGSHLSGAAVSNLIGVLPGKDASAPALALMAHYDSVPGSPGAADDAAGVASVLEIIRAIQANGIPDRDVAVILTDGEEAGLLGARAFFAEDPLVEKIGYVINLETRGGGGRTAMFETAAMNGNDIDLFRRTAGMPDGNSLTVFVYEHLPNDTDFTVAKQHGKAGLNYAFIGSQFDYHSPSSTPDQLDLGSLQHMGSEVLPTVAALVSGPLPGRAPDVVYGDLFGLFVISYPPTIGWIILLGIAGAAGIASRRSWQRFGKLTGVDVLRGVGTSFYLMALGGAVLEFGRRLTGVGSGWIAYRPLLARFPVFETMMALVGLGAVLVTLAFARRGQSRGVAGGLVLAIGLATCLVAGVDLVGLILGGAGLLIALLTFKSPSRIAGLRIGLLIVPLAASLALQILAPTVAFIVMWPLIPAALAAVIGTQGAQGHPLGRVANIALASVTIAWLGGLFHAVMLGLDLPILALLPIWLAVPMTVCLFTDTVPLGRVNPVAPGAILIAGLLLSMFLRFTDPWTHRYPAPAEPVYIVDRDAGAAWHASVLLPDSWMEGFLAASGVSPTSLSLPFYPNPVTAAPVSPVPVDDAKAHLETLADGRLSLTVQPPTGADRVVVSIRSAARVDEVAINGHSSRYVARDGTRAEFTLDAQQWGRVTWSGPSGFTMSFRTSDPQSVKIETAAIYPRWMSEVRLPPMPPSDEPWDIAGSTVVLGSVLKDGD